MGYGKRVTWDTIRELAFGDMSDTLINVGTALTKAARVVKITNHTDVALYVSDNSTNDKLYLPTNSYQLWDITSNKALGDKPQFIEIGTLFSSRYITGSAASSGMLTIEVLTVESGS